MRNVENMKVVLGDIADIRTATVFRERAPEPAPNGNVLALTIKDVVAGWPPEPQALDRIHVDDHLMKNCLAAGQILIPSRGDYYPARYFLGSEFRFFPLGQINLISPSESVLGGYLSWCLNQPDAQQQIKRVLTGTNIRSLTKPNLQSIEIVVPEPSVQKDIATLQHLWEQSRSRKMKLLQIEELEVTEICRVLAQESL